MDESPPDPHADRRRRLRQLADSRPDALFGGTDEHGIKGWLGRTDSYGFVLLTLAAFIWGFVPLAGTTGWLRIPTILVFYLTVLIAMHTSYVRESRLRLAIVLDTGLLVGSIVGVALDNDTIRAFVDLGFAALLFVTALVIMRRVIGHTTITSRTVSGAVCAWLFLALAFASLFASMELFDPNSFTSAHGAQDFSSMLYFSLVTVATLGYGDIVPVTEMARSAATLEAVMGQIYLITVVARMVSLLGTSRLSPTADPAPDDPAA